MVELAKLGFFQFDNLIRGRIPFLLVNLGVDLSIWYKSVEAMHIANCTIHCTHENYLELITAKKLPLHFAVVVLDQDGTHGKKIASHLESLGYINSHYVNGGFAGIQKEKAENF